VERVRRVLGTLTVGLFGLLVLAAEPAAAGGSSFTFDRESYEPGAQAFAWSTLYLEDSTDDGPYGAWLATVESRMNTAGIPPDAVYVGDISIHDGPYEPSNMVSPRHARLTFTVPDVPPGEYTIVNCNRPCTAPIMDITWGGTMVVSGPAAPPPAPTTTTTTTAPATTVPTTSAPAPTTTVEDLEVEPLVADSGGSDGPGPLAAVAVVGLSVLVAAGVWTFWSRRPSSTGTTGVDVAGLREP